MLSRWLERYLSLQLLKEDLRKIGANLITAGIIGVFITYITNFSWIIWVGCSWVILPGSLISFYELKGGSKNES